MYEVLIVEDDPMVAMINEQYVCRSQRFHVVRKCKDGKSALEFLEKNKVDLIILDVFMPYVDGLETLRQIRAKQIPVDVIMVTAANDKDTLEEAIHLGAIDYLVKPFAFDRFNLALDKFIAQMDALKDVAVFSQKHIDSIIVNSPRNKEEAYPKGIRKHTLQIIMDYLQKSGDAWLTGDAIADQVGLSSVTVRRYMNHLTESGEVICNTNYETGGRPCMLYRIKDFQTD